MGSISFVLNEILLTMQKEKNCKNISQIFSGEEQCDFSGAQN